MPEKPVESSQKPPVESHSCDICGTLDAQEFGDRWLCLDCYAGCGSCCSGSQTEELC